MNNVDVSKVIDYVKSVWTDAVSYCQENYSDFPEDYEATNGSEAEAFFQCDFMEDSGTLSGAIMDKQGERPICKMVALLKHTQGAQDPSLPIETYAQTYNIDMIVPERYRNFVTRIWERFADSMKSIATNIDSTACLIKTDQRPTFSAKQANAVLDNLQTSEVFKASMDFLLVVFSTAILSNDITATLSMKASDGSTQIYLSDETTKIEGQLNFMQLQFKSVKEVRADSSIRETLRFRANNRQMSLHISAIATTSTIDTALVKDIEAGTYFKNMYQLTKTGNGSTSTDYWILVQGATTYAYGSLLAFEADFQPTY